MKKKFPFYRQLDQMDCGPSCLRMIAKYHGKSFSNEYLREKAHITIDGVTFAGIAEAAESIGLRTAAANVDFNVLAKDAPLPCIAHWRQRHFVVIYKIDEKEQVHIADPAHGLIVYSKVDFLKAWLNLAISNGNNKGMILVLDPSPRFLETNIRSK